MPSIQRRMHIQSRLGRSDAAQRACWLHRVYATLFKLAGCKAETAALTDFRETLEGELSGVDHEVSSTIKLRDPITVTS